MNLLYSWLGTEKIYTNMGIFNIFFQLQVMEIIQNYPFSHFLYSISFLGDISHIEIRLVTWF